MKKLLLLNSSIIVNKPLLNKDTIKLEYGKNRIKSYIDGFLKLKENNVYSKFEKVILIDNTVSSVNKIPAKIIDLLPDDTTFLVSRNSAYGRMNKGAGMLDSLKLNKEIITDYDLIFYYEPRLLLQSTDFIDEFLSGKENMFSFESDKRVKTGYFGSSSKDLNDFIDSYSVKEILNDNLHIELLMYQFYEQRNTRFEYTSTSLWKNYLSEIYEKY